MEEWLKTATLQRYIALQLHKSGSKSASTAPVSLSVRVFSAFLEKKTKKQNKQLYFIELTGNRNKSGLLLTKHNVEIKA